MRFKKCPQLPGARRTRSWHHHGSDFCQGHFTPYRPILCTFLHTTVYLGLQSVHLVGNGLKSFLIALSILEQNGRKMLQYQPISVSFQMPLYIVIYGDSQKIDIPLKKQLIQRFKSKANWYSEPLGEVILCIYLYSQEHVHSILTVIQNRFTVKQLNPAQYVL